MKYLTIKEVAQNWNISERRIRTLCSKGRIEGAKRMGWMWSIPENTLKPVDARTTRHKSELKVRCLHMNFKIIDGKKQQLDNARPLSKHTLHSLRENMFVEWTYNSNAIEGNTLTISETKVVLEGITIGGKSMREHLEVINHKAAILFLEDLIKQNEPLSEWSIKNIHGLVLKSIDDENAGSYRKENVLISGAKHKPPQHFLVKEQMEELVSLYNGKWNSLHPIERAAMLHGEFVKIHPFIDGNGRTARLLMNFELMKSGFPPTIIKANTRPQYYDHLDFAHTSGDYKSFVTLVSKCVEESLDLWLSMI